jgi:hypothetical protein
MAERETLGIAELTEEATLNQTGKAGRRHQFLLYQYRAEDRSQNGL